MAFNPEKYRKDFPILNTTTPPTYFDNACMTLRPRQVITAITDYYEKYPACGGRSSHSLARTVDDKTYLARRKVQKFVSANKPEHIVFLRNTTEAINLVSRTYPFKKGDVILTTDKEHNSNLLPWQQLAKKTNVKHVVVETNKDGTFNLENYKEALEKHNVALVAMGLTANLDGVSLPGKEITKLAHKKGAKVFFDAAQTAPHQQINLKKLGTDLLAFSGHKMLGPTSTGVLTGTKELLETLKHDNVGGETVQDTTYTEATWEPLPQKFEAGLQHYSGILGLGAAVTYLESIGLNNIQKHEQLLTKTITEGLLDIKGFILYGPQDHKQRGGITTFNIDGINHHDIALTLNSHHNTMVRSGAHCVHSWFNKHKIAGSVRASTYLYNTQEEAEGFVEAVKDIVKMLK